MKCSSRFDSSTPSHLVCSLDVHLHNQIPVLVSHILEADISQDASIVDQHINTTKCIDGRLDDPIAILHAVIVGHGFAAGRADLLDYNICSLPKGASA